MKKSLLLQYVAWGLSLLSVSVAVIAWAQALFWHVQGISPYKLFPLFGLLAFSLLWAQYMVIALRRYWQVAPEVLSDFFRWSGYLVLIFILLHPGLLIYQLWHDGAGWPPASFMSYVKPSLKWLTILGLINLTILLLYELRRVLARYSWWRYAGYLVDLVIFSIFYHGLRLGTLLQKGWYRQLWFVYGLSLVIAIGYSYYNRWQTAKKSVVS